MTARESQRRRHITPMVLLGAAIVLILYYVFVLSTGVLRGTTGVETRGTQPNPTGDYLTLQLRSQDVDLSNRLMAATILPVPHGIYVGSKSGEMSKSLRIEVTSGGTTTSVVTYPGESIIDPTALSLPLDRGDAAYPFDSPYANIQLSVQDDETGAAVPFVVNIENAARPWVMTADFGEQRSENNMTLQPITVEGRRDTLSIALVGFYVLAILLTTLIGIVTIGTAVLKRTLDFSNVIWLSATMLSFPTLRAAMPGAPPIGAGIDFLITFPCTVLVAAMLVTTGVHLVWREGRAMRKIEVGFRKQPAGSREELPSLADA